MLTVVCKVSVYFTALPQIDVRRQNVTVEVAEDTTTTTTTTTNTTTTRAHFVSFAAR
jgi:hypothetical protein